MIEKALQTSRLEVEGGGTTGAGTETPLHPWRGPCQSRYSSTSAAGGCSLKEAAAHEEPTLEQAPGRNCGWWRKACAGDHLAGIAACNGTMLDQSISEGLYIMERPTLVQFLKNCSPWEGSMSEVCEVLHSVEETPCWSRGKV